MAEKTHDEDTEQEQGVSRRTVLGAGALGIAAMAGSSALIDTPAWAQTHAAAPGGAAPAPPALALSESDITYRSGDTDIKAYLAQPANAANGIHAGARPAIIVIHEIWGLTEHMRDVTRRFARQGYVVIAPDLFTREGAPQLDTNDRGAMMKFLGSIPDRRVVADLEAAITFLKGPKVNASRIGSVGFCMGGLYSYLLATHSTNLAAAVEFYGRIVYTEKTDNKPDSPLDLVPQLKCPLLGNFGELDPSIPVTDVEKLKDALKTIHLPWKVNIYPGASHAFFNDTRQSYQKEAATDAWNETLDFFKAHLITNSA